MKTLTTVIIISSILSLAGCYSDATKESDHGSTEQNTPATSRPAANRY